MILEGRTCVFAGGSGGDGIAAVKALCAAGMNVAMMTHMPEQARKLAEEIAWSGAKGQCIPVMDGACQQPPKTEAEVYEDIYRQFGSIDVINSNTGDDGRDDTIDSTDDTELLKSTEHLLGGSYRMLKTALPYLRQSKAARVIFMTTVEGVRGGKLESFTNAVAKGAVWSLMKNCAARLAEEGITVNCISKGGIQRVKGAAPQNSKEPKKKEASKMLPYIPEGRLGTPEDLAAAICYLASEEAGYVTGSTLDVSGGLNLR